LFGRFRILFLSSGSLLDLDKKENSMRIYNIDKGLVVCQATSSLPDKVSVLPRQYVKPVLFAVLCILMSSVATGISSAPNAVLHTFTGDGNVPRIALSLDELNGSELPVIDFSAYSHGEPEIYADKSHAAEPSNTFRGRLVLNDGRDTPLNFRETSRGKPQASSFGDPKTLPGFDFEFVQVGSHIIPKVRGLHVTGHPDWNYILEPGRVWNESRDQGYSRAAIPFALQENQANCTHNGILTFLFKNDGSMSNVALQVGGETCVYFQYELWGLVAATYVQGTVEGEESLVENYKSEVLNRLPSKPIAELNKLYPNVVVSNIAIEQAAGETTHGVFYQGVHYSAPCRTRNGDYPFCEVMGLPSYSTAKTAVANFAHALLTQQNGDSARYMKVTDYVSECQGGSSMPASNWSEVNVEQALDMATGNYRQSAGERDEDSAPVLEDFFLKYSHAAKIEHACEYYPRRSVPGAHFAYHSSDTYVAGVAMDNYTRGDLFKKLVTEVYKPLHLSPAAYTTVRTQELPTQPFWSHGMNWHADDMIKLGLLINQRGVIEGKQVLDGAIMDDMLGKGEDLGLPATSSGTRYLNGVWRYDMGQRPQAVCPPGSWVSYLSGYGGIAVVLFPNGAVYYNVSDSQVHDFAGAEAELNKISKMCPKFGHT